MTAQYWVLAMPERAQAIDLFCGAGGLSLGLRKAGFKVAAAIELDPCAVETYSRNIGRHVLLRDIGDVCGSELLNYAGIRAGECDLLAGGPPCQGFSVQRRGSDKDPRNSLVLEFVRLIEEITPRYFLIENVAGLLSKRGKPFINELSARLMEDGYAIQIMKLDAINFGVAQYRKRVIIVGERVGRGSGAFRFAVDGSHRSQGTVKDAIGDLPSPPLDGAPHPDVPNHSREARLSARNIERLKHIPPGGGRQDLPDHLQLDCHRNNPRHRHVDVYGRLDWNKPSGTITARFDSFTRGRFAHPVEHRSLTLREGARLQGFPDTFVFYGNREEVARQIGNAVPPPLAEALGRAVLEGLGSRKKMKVRASTGRAGMSPPP